MKPVRWLYGTPDNALPTSSYGPWSPIYTSYNPPFATGPLMPLSTVSNVVSDASATRVHEVMPAFTYGGDTSMGNTVSELYRVVVFTDADCLNPVFRGAITGAPAYAARASGPLGLPGSTLGVTDARSTFLADGVEPDPVTYDGLVARSNESDVAPLPSGVVSFSGRKVDLWDTNSPTGRYYWAAMPVDAAPGPGGVVTYRETELAQDSCAAGRRLSFAKTSEPVVTGQIAPYASGLSPYGRLVAAARTKPKFYGQPLVAWQPLAGADRYEVQWSTKGYPWKTAGTTLTFGTSVTLPLTPGTWFYRVRGIDFLMTGSKPQLSWSKPVPIVVTKPRFRVLRGGK